MSAVKKTLLFLASEPPFRAEAARPVVKRGLECEAMEDRQLLSAAPWGLGDPSLASGRTLAADHQAWAKAGDKTFTPPTISATAKADMTTLQTDMKTLQTETQANAAVTSAQAAVKADAKTIASALGATLKTLPAGTTDPGLAAGFKGPRGAVKVDPGGPMLFVGAGAPGAGKTLIASRSMLVSSSGSTTLPAAIVTKLEDAGVTSTQITQFQTDQTNLQNAIKAVDPTLQTKIQADQAAIQKDMPAPSMHFDHMITATTTTSTS